MATFRIEMSFDQWKYLQKCWKTVSKNIIIINNNNNNNNNKNTASGGDSNSNNENKNESNNITKKTDWSELNQCINVWNAQLFYNYNNDNNNSSNNNNTKATDISIETMNNLLLEIDYDRYQK